MLTLKEIIENRQLYPDALVVTIPNVGTVSLGDIRGLGSERLDSITKQADELKSKEQKLLKDTETLLLAQQETARLYQDLQDGRLPDGTIINPAPVKTDPFSVLDRYKGDPLIGPVAELLRTQAQQLAEMQKKANKEAEELRGTIQAMAKAYVSDQTLSAFNSIPNRDEKITYEQLVRHAVDNSLFGPNKMPDIRRAYKDLTAEKTLQSQLEAAKKQGREETMAELTKQGAIIRMPRPSGPSAGGEPIKAYTSIDDALKAAENDPEIWKIANQPSA